MPNQQPQIIKQNTFVGGVQDFVPYHLVRDISAVRLENCDIHTRGTVRRRGGLREHFSHWTSDGNDVIDPLLLKMFTGIRGIGPIQVAIYNANSAAHVTVDQGGTSQQNFDFLPGFSFDETGDAFKLLDRIYFGKTGQVPLYWEVGASALQQELAVPGFPGTTIPPVVTGVFFQGRGWAGGDPSAEDLVYFSNALGTSGDEEASRSPLIWDRVFQAFRMQTGRVRAIIPFRDVNLVVFTDAGIEMLEPNCCEILETHRLTLHWTTGCPFRQTIQVCGEDIYFMDQEGHVRSLAQTDLDESRGVLNAPLSLTIKNVIDRQTKHRLDRSRSAFVNGIYWIAMPTNGAQIANEVWGWSIRDRSWVGPYFFGKDENQDILTPFTIGGMTGCFFDSDQQRMYILDHQLIADEIKTHIALEVEDLTDDGVMIPVVVATKSYSPIDEVRKTWFHTEQELRFLHSPQDQSLSFTIEVRSDEGAYHATDPATLVPDAGPLTFEAFTNSGTQLSPYTRINLKTSLTSTAPRGYGIQERVTIRDDQTRWELITLQVSGFIDPEEFAGIP